jgi:hypothetical protein
MSNSLLDALRAQASQSIQEETEKGSASRENEWLPTDKPTKIRLLPLQPLKDGTPTYPYRTHSFHWLEKGRDDGKDIKLWVPKKVNKDGVLVNDPIDDFVKKLYDTKLESEKKIAGKFKRKRNFFFNAIIYEEGKDPQLKVLIDSSADGKLARKICTIMGIPFCKDIEDKWFPDKNWKFDPDQTYYDLIDIKAGFDLKIKKTSIGSDPWAFNYDESFVITKGPRALSAEEKVLFDSSPNLDNFVNVETDYYKVMEYFNRSLASIGVIDSPKKETKSEVKSYKSIPEVKTSAAVDDDLDEDDLRAALSDD